jgi:hypothetical protein
MKGLCIVQDCGNRSYSKGYCVKHYRRVQKHGDPLFTSRADRKEAVPNTAQAAKCSIGGCVLNAKAKRLCGRHYYRLNTYNNPLAPARKGDVGFGSVNRGGYRQIMVDGTSMLEHRYVMEQYLGTYDTDFNAYAFENTEE